MILTETFMDLLTDAFMDTAKLAPFLFFTYLAMEYLENRAEEKTISILFNAKKKGPLLGGLLGVLPQCGFSAAAASLYSGGVVTMGTMIAVFLSTSDEMLPVMISGKAGLSTILFILGGKAVAGILFGTLIDFGHGVISRKALNRSKLPHGKSKAENQSQPGEVHHIHELCEHDHCHCESGSILKSALIHSLQILFFIFLITLFLNLAIDAVGIDKVMQAAAAHPFLSIFISALVGLVPNCASSVAITTFYLEGMISAGTMFSGLLSCAGVGLLVLFRTNHNLKTNVTVLGLLYLTSVFCGAIIEAVLRYCPLP